MGAALGRAIVPAERLPGACDRAPGRECHGMAETAAQRDESNPSVRFSAGAWNVVLCNGMIRSASTWSYNVALRLLRAAVGSRCYGDYSENTQAFLDAAPATADY